MSREASLYQTTADYEFAKTALLGKTFTREDAYRLRAIIDDQTAPDGYEPEALVIGGVEIVQSIVYPVQKAFVHPFTLANFISRVDFNHPINIIKSGRENVEQYLTPLKPDQIELLERLKAADNAAYGRVAKS